MTRARDIFRHALRSAAPGLLAIVCAGWFLSCGLVKKVGANKVLIVTWIAMPKVDVAPFTQQASLGMTTVTALFNTTTPALQTTPITRGFAAFFGAGKQVKLLERDPDKSPGIYAQTSTEDQNLSYDTDPNHRFGFKACAVDRGGCAGEEFTINRITAAPRTDPSTIAFSPAPAASALPGFLGQIALNQDLSVSFPPPKSDTEQYRPMITVIGPGSDPTQPPGALFNSVPTSGADLVKFFTEKPPTTIIIPGKTFAQAGPYLVLATTARLNLDTSDNLFLGSGALAGAASAFIFEAR